MSKGKVIPFQPPVPDDDDDDCDCPKCPPPGAPAWLATFADIATNLMAFFVLILGFAQFDEPSFKKFAGAMREQFGASMIEGHTRGDTIIDMNPEIKPDDSENDLSASGSGGPQAAQDSTARAVAEALREAMADGSLQVDTGTGTVTLKLPATEGPEAAQALAEAIAAAAGTTPELRKSDPAAAPTAGETAGARPEDAGQPAGDAGAGAGAGDAGPKVRAELAGLALESVLRNQIADGKLDVEQQGAKVQVVLGAGGSFRSGSADLSAEAQGIMDQIARTGDSPDRRITVIGHTDDVPLAGGPYTDNFGLAAARASSVVRALVDSGKVDPSRISAVSKGEFAPLADNATEEGRARNRRIEIVIDYGG